MFFFFENLFFAGRCQRLVGFGMQCTTHTCVEKMPFYSNKEQMTVHVKLQKCRILNEMKREKNQDSHMDQNDMHCNGI